MLDNNPVYRDNLFSGIIVFCFCVSDEMITKIFGYAHEYQICTVLSKAEEILNMKLENTTMTTNDRDYNVDAIDKTIDLLIFADKYTNDRLISTSVSKLAEVPRNWIIKGKMYKLLNFELKFMVADRRLKVKYND